METRFTTYNIEFLDSSYTSSHWTFSKTVIVRAYVENKVIAKNTYGYIDAETVYQKIIDGLPINLDNCYLKNFSSLELKRTLNIDENSMVELENFSAQNAFFDCTLGSDFSQLRFKGGVNFNNTIFSHGNLSFFNTVFYDGTVNFKNVEFGNGEINFQYADFGNYNVSFYKSIFYGGLVSFVNATFKNGNVNFSTINFNNSKVKFHFAKFGEGDINFQKTKFGDQTFDCRRVEFGNGKIDFRRSTFGNGFVTFDESESQSGRINFKLARFGNNDISFKQVDFSNSELIFESVSFGSGHALFNESKTKKISFKGSRIDVYLDLRVDSCDTVDLSDTILRDIIDIQPVKENVAITTFYLQGMRNLGKFIIDWRKNDVKSLIKTQPETTLREKAEQFNILKENFHLNGQYEDEDEAYIQFRRFEQRGDVKDALEQGGKKLVLLPYYVFRWIVFDKMGLFATSPLRVLFSMIVIYILFSFSYTVLPYFDLGRIINSVGATDNLNYLQTSFYHSAITFLTIGYGDYYPTGFSRAISVVEGWTGLFLMSYFTVAFVRKILR